MEQSYYNNFFKNKNITMIPINLLLEMKRRRDEESEQHTDNTNSRSIYNEAQSYRDRYKVHFNINYGKERVTILFIHAIIKSLYSIHKFNDAYYNKEIKNGIIEHTLYFSFKEELKYDSTLMSGILIDFDNTFDSKWWHIGKKETLHFKYKLDAKLVKIAEEIPDYFDIEIL